MKSRALPQLFWMAAVRASLFVPVVRRHGA
jgi:hypothetical protein